MLVDRPGYVYAILFPNGKRYIGVTSTSMEKRFRDHLSASRSAKQNKTKLYKTMSEIDHSLLKMEFIEKCHNKEDCIAKEKAAIERYDSVDNGYNTVYGGENPEGYVFSKEDRIKISIAQKKRFEREEERKKASEATKLWMKNSPEKVEKMNARRREVVTTVEHRKMMSDKMKKVYKDNPELVKRTGETLSRRYKEDSDLRERISRALGGGPIEVLKDGVVVSKYPSVGTAAREMKLSLGNICSVLKGRRNHTGGYTFRRK